MKPRLVLLMLIPLAVGGVSYYAATKYWFAPPAPPVVEFPAHLDLGEHATGKLVVGHFTITNRGGSDLTIDQIRTNCSCSGIEQKEGGRFVRVDSLRLKPGERADLAIRVSVRGVPAGAAMHNLVAFRTNDPDQPTGRLEAVVRRVLGSLSVSPASVVFGTVPRGTEVRRVLEVRDTSVKPRTVTRATTTGTDRVAVRLFPVKAEPRQGEPTANGALIGRLEVVVDTASVGYVNGSIQVHLEGDDEERDPVPVTGRVVEPIEISPSVLILPRQTAKGPVYSANVMCRSNRGEAVALSVGSVPPGLTAEVGGEGDDATRVVRIAWDPQRGIKPGGQSEQVRFRAKAGGETAVLVLRVNLQP